jgi:hypothetical protein
MYAENSQRIRYFSEISEVAAFADAFYLIYLKNRIIESVYNPISSYTLGVAVREIKA